MATYTNVAVSLGNQSGNGTSKTFTFSASSINNLIDNTLPSACKITKAVIKFRGAKPYSFSGEGDITISLGSYSKSYSDVIANDGGNDDFGSSDTLCTSDDIKGYINSNGRFSSDLNFKLGSSTLPTFWRVEATIYFDYQTPYTVSVSAGVGGTVSSTGGYCYNSDTFTVTATPNTGYKFDGWANNSGTIVSNVNPFSTGVYNNLQFSAVFEPITYYVAFDGNYADSGSVATITAKYGENFTLPENGFVKRVHATWKGNADDATLGYRASTHKLEFNGWKFGLNESYVYPPGEEFANMSTTDGATVTCYADWSDTQFEHPIATRPGYKFKEWNTKADGSGTPYTDETFWTSGDVADRAYETILYAQWERSACTITTKASPSSGGTVTGGGTYDIGTNITLTATPSDGYQFKYWIDDDGEQILDNRLNMEVVEDYALTAYFRINRMHLGTAQPKEMYIGETPIKEIYLGTTKIYEQ